MYEDDFTRAMAAVCRARAAAHAASDARSALTAAEKAHADSVAALRALGWDDAELTQFAVPSALPKPRAPRKPRPKADRKLAAVVSDDGGDVVDDGLARFLREGES